MLSGWIKKMRVNSSYLKQGADIQQPQERTGITWTLEFHFIPQSKAETTACYQHLQQSHRINCINCNQKRAVTLIHIWFCPRIQAEQIEAPVRPKPRESCCVPSFPPGWIPGCLTATSHEDKTILCDCWLWLGLITISLQRVKSGSWSPKAAETVLALFLWTDPIIPSGSGLGFPPGPKAAN